MKHADVKTKYRDTPVVARVCYHNDGYVNGMTEMLRVTVNWTGFNGAPGYTNLHFRDFTEGPVDQAMADGSVAKVDSWIANWQSSLPSTVKFQVNPQVQRIEDTTGDLVGFFNTTPAAQRTGTGTGSYSAASGMCFNWYTNGVRNGRRIRGRTFVVPVAGNALGPDGTLDDTKVTGLRTATASLLSATGSGDFGVWSRPSGPGATDGAWWLTTSFTLPDKVAVLRSRRD